jgi:hypothetical protein
MPKRTYGYTEQEIAELVKRRDERRERQRQARERADGRWVAPEHARDARHQRS